MSVNRRRVSPEACADNTRSPHERAREAARGARRVTQPACIRARRSNTRKCLICGARCYCVCVCVCYGRALGPLALCVVYSRCQLNSDACCMAQVVCASARAGPKPVYGHTSGSARLCLHATNGHKNSFACVCLRAHKHARVCVCARANVKSRPTDRRERARARALGDLFAILRCYCRQWLQLALLFLPLAAYPVALSCELRTHIVDCASRRKSLSWQANRLVAC